MDMLPVKYNDKIIRDVFSDKKNSRYNNNVLGIVLATKPCFYKLWSVIDEAKKQGIPYIIMHSGQHYDGLVGYGAKEFDFEKNIAIDMQLRGDLSQKSAEMFIKAKEIHSRLKKSYPNVNLIPYVNGDTVTAGIMPAAWMFASNQRCIQGEAGLRSMSPKAFIRMKSTTNVAQLIKMQDNDDWITNRTEPFPEQYDTFISAAGSEYFFAPTTLNRDYLIREGYDKDKIFTVGNTVVDVIDFKKNMKPEESIFSQYPQLEKDSWIRFDIHRRDNLTERRFKAIIGSIINLVMQGKNVCLVELNATKNALEQYGLRQKLLDLAKTHKNFLFTPLWKEYGNVMEFINSKNCSLIATDSGSMQEELNELKKPCVTIRFNTDRPETVMYGKSNLLIPPLNDKLMTDTVKYVIDNEYFSRKKGFKRLYGKDVAKKIIRQTDHIFQENTRMFSWAHEQLKIYKDKDDKIGYL